MFRHLPTALLLALLFGLCHSVQAQEHNFRKYSIEEGLPRSGVYTICEDRDGFLWIGIEGGGVSVFDGRDFNTFTTEDGLSSNTIRAIFQDDEGQMWFGTQNGGVCVYNFDQFEVIDESTGLPNNTVRAISQDDAGNMWIGTFGGGVCRFNQQGTGSITRFTENEGLADDKVRCMLKDSKGQMWIGTDGGVSVFDGKRFQNYGTHNGLPGSRVLGLFEDGNGNMWIGTRHGVVKFDSGNFTLFDESDGLVQNRVRTISQDRFGNMWFGTRQGVSRFDGRNFYTFTEQQGLSNNRIRTILADSQGNLWFGTYFGGINRYSSSEFIHYSDRNGLNNNQVFAIDKADGNAYWFATFGGVSRLALDAGGNVTSATHLTEAEGLPDNEVRDVLQDGESYLWLASAEGVALYDLTTEKFLPLDAQLTNRNANFIFEEAPGILWIGSDGAIFRLIFEGEDRRRYSLDRYEGEDGMAGKNPICMYRKGNGELLIGFRDGGISVFDGTRFHADRFPDEIENVVCFTEHPEGFLWVGTEGHGLFKYTDKVVGHFTTTDGLRSNNVHLLAWDAHEHLWVGSEKGLDQLTFGADGELSECSHHERAEGFVGIETNLNAQFRADNSTIWFGTIKGATLFDPWSHSTNKSKARIHITGVALPGHHEPWQGSPYVEGVSGRFDLPKNLVLPYNQNQLTFRFTGISLRIPSKVRYRWKLEPFDQDFSEPSEQTEFTYTNLPFGQYTFKVMACNEDGVWNEIKEADQFTFTIEPPFWRTTWFYILGILAGLAIFIGFSQLRVKRLRSAKQQLENEVSARTTELRDEKERVESKNAEIEEKNKEITDSINYAQRIQHAIMQPKWTAAEHLRDQVFVFYRPKDIVSGDFYWFARQGNRSLLAAADCTGHGVPGAFMSMIGIAFLNEIVNKKQLSDPAKILDDLRSNVVEALVSEGHNTKDGMDIALISLDYDEMEVQFAGAHNPLYLIRKANLPAPKGEVRTHQLEGKDDVMLYEFRASKMPIGMHDMISTPFSSHQAKLIEGDLLYMFTDGYVDQFGGEKGKKFLAKRLKNLLLENHDLPLPSQEKALVKAFDEWMGVQDQVDDILVMGLRVGQPH